MSFSCRFLAAAAAVLVVSSCGGGGGGGTEPESATRLAVQTQPSGAVTGSALATQPVVLVQTASGATAASSSASVSATLNGQGTLSGVTTVSAVNGVARFTNLAVTGLGTYTLTFSSSGLASALSTSFEMAPLPPVKIQIISQPIGTSVNVLLPQAPVIALIDASGAVASSASGTVTAEVASGPGTFTGTATLPFTNGMAVFNTFRFATPGKYTLRFTSPGFTPVVSNEFTILGPPASISFAPSRFITNLEAGSFMPSPVVRDASGAELTSVTPTLVSRNVNVATVLSNGVVSPVGRGQTAIVASVPGGLADSLLLGVVPTGGWALYTDFASYSLKRDTTVTVAIIVDTRLSAKRVASGQVEVRFSPSQLTYLSAVGDATVAPAVNDAGAATGVLRISFANPSGYAGATTIARVTFRAASTVGIVGQLQITASELVASDYTDVLPLTLQLSQPIVLR